MKDENIKFSIRKYKKCHKYVWWLLFITVNKITYITHRDEFISEIIVNVVISSYQHIDIFVMSSFHKPLLPWLSPLVLPSQGSLPTQPPLTIGVASHTISNHCPCHCELPSPSSSNSQTSPLSKSLSHLTLKPTCVL